MLSISSLHDSIDISAVVAKGYNKVLLRRHIYD
jgi:hypothetical protein